MSLKLLDKEVDQRGVESTGLGGLAGNVCTLLGVKGFCDGIEVQSLFTEVLKKMGNKDRFRNAASGYEARVFPMTESTGGKLCSAMIGKLPWEHLKCGKACHSGLSGPLCGLDCFVKLVVV